MENRSQWNPWFIATALVGLIIGWWWWNREPVNLEPPLQRVTSPRADLPTHPRPIKRPVQPRPPQVQTKIVASLPPTETKPKDAVPFRMIEDWVVAYGDILIGKPSQPDMPPTGWVAMPKIQLWKEGRIPYALHVDLPDVERVLRVVEYFNTHTRLKFTPYNGEPDSVVFAPFSSEACLSYLGRIGGHQPVYLDDRCRDSEIMHEVMHLAGVIHEHSRPDRDQYIRVLWDNIIEEKRDQFEVVPPALAKSLMDRPFDYQSVMLYPTVAFSRDRASPTLQSVTDKKIEPTQGALSEEDIRRLEVLYGPP